MITPENRTVSKIRQSADQSEGTKIIIADDNTLVRMRLKNLCRALDFTNSVTEVDSVEALRAALDQNHVDLVLLGPGLHANGGLDNTHADRAVPMLPAPAIVMVTDSECPDGALRRTERGVSACLALQDLSLDTLQETARTALRISRQKADWSRVPDISRRARGTQDLRPVVGRIMRQVRKLRDLDRMDQPDAIDRVKQIEASLQRLWDFLDPLDDSAEPENVATPTIPGVRGQKPLFAARINARAPSERPAAKTVKPLSVFRRRPD
tara:strand:+ start:274 stop:1074 length:801 start_codon:yes stop_codon:yes gene_type:complete